MCVRRGVSQIVRLSSALLAMQAGARYYWIMNRTYTDAIDVKEERVEWLWQDRIPLGALTIIEGEMKQGKSLVTVDLAARISSGRILPLDFRRRARRGVVILAIEDPRPIIRARLEAAGADLKRCAFPDDVQTLADVKPLTTIVRQKRAALVIIDPLASFLPKGTNYKDEVAMRQVLNPLALLAQRLKIAIVLIRHHTKAEGAKAVNRGGGAVSIGAQARSVLMVGVAPDNTDTHVLAPVVANYANPAALAFSIATKPATTLKQPTPCLNWQGETHYAAVDLCKRPKPEGAYEAATAFVSQFSGMVPSSTIMKRAERAGIAERTLNRVKADLGIKHKKRGRQWFWMFDADKRAKPANDANLASGKVGRVRNVARFGRRSSGAKIIPFRVRALEP